MHRNDTQGITGSLASRLDDTALGGAEPELDNLVRHIEADQSIEIDRRRQLLGRR
jgi:hypothetical protein